MLGVGILYIRYIAQGSSPVGILLRRRSVSYSPPIPVGVGNNYYCKLQFQFNFYFFSICFLLSISPLDPKSVGIAGSLLAASPDNPFQWGLVGTGFNHVL